MVNTINDTVIIFCPFCFCVQGSAMGRQSRCAIQCTVYKNANQKVVCSQHFSETDFTSPDCMPEQNGSYYFLCSTHTLTFSTKTYRTYLPFPSYAFLITTCCLYTYLPVPKPLNTYSKLSLMHPKHFQVQSLGCANKNVCGGELGSISPKARLSVPKKLIWTELLN